MTVQAIRYRIAESGDLGVRHGNDELIIKNPITLEVPASARLSSVANQYGVFWLWALADPAEKERIRIEIYLVGPEMQPEEFLLDAKEYHDLGTLQVRGGEQVYMAYGRKVGLVPQPTQPPVAAGATI